LEDAEQDLREKKIKRWLQKAVDKEEWASVFETKLSEGRRAKE
jgi:hypothetical protein